jgi:hypothetical protein
VMTKFSKEHIVSGKVLTIVSGLAGSLVLLWAAASLGAASGRASTEPEPAAFARARSATDALPTRAVQGLQRLALQPASSRRVTSETFLVRRDGELCLVTLFRESVNAGCSPAGAFFRDRPVVFGIDEFGGPTAFTEIRISGVARPAVALVRAHFGDTTLTSAPTADGGFEISATGRQLIDGRPTELEVLGRNGKVIAEFDLPQE